MYDETTQQKAWIDILRRCEESNRDCVLDKLVKLEKSLNDSSRLQGEVLFPALDLLLKAPSDARANLFLSITERLVSKIDLSNLTSNTEHSTFNNIEVNIFLIGKNTSNHNGSEHLTNKAVSLEIDLLGIAQNNNGSASVVMLTINKLHEVLDSGHFHAQNGERTTMNAQVVMVILPQTANHKLSEPINITFQHLQVSDSADTSVCVFWSEGAWIRDGCFASGANSTHSVCTCNHLSTFALIMQTQPTTESDPIVEKLSMVFVVVGLIFLTLAVLTFALCRFNSRISNMARLNLSVCLLLGHSLFLITQMAQPQKMLCKILAGLLHFLFLCSFMWMSAEAVLLFLSVRKLRQIKAKDRTGPHWRYKLLVGYGIPLVIVAVSAAVVPDGHGSQQCWLKTHNGFNWSFLGPACFILTGNIILFVIILITIHTTLREARSEASTVKYTRLLLFKIMGQCLILGCPWMLLMAQESKVLELIALFLVSQQGTMIFLIHCLLNPEVRKQYANWWQKYGLGNKASSSTFVLSTTSQQGSETHTRHTTLASGPQTEDVPMVRVSFRESQKSE